MAKRKIINLALQGGGAHGAFTWGVLDTLAGHEKLEFGTVSGTSAGAVNAVAFAAGYAEGGRAGAKAKLMEVWKAVHAARVPDIISFNPLLASMASVTNVTRVLSPYAFNPMGFDPLRRVLNDHIDFAKVRQGPIGLMIAATDIATGRARYFTRKEMTVEAVLASACLPTLHHATVIEGRAYWDGGFSANPGVVALAEASSVEDTLIVLLNPTSKSGVPTSAEEIASETGRLTFNAPFLRDVALIEAVRDMAPRGLARAFAGRTPHEALIRHRFHLIEAGRHTSALPAGSKLKPDWGLFTYLHGAGRMEAHKWLDTTLQAVGRRGSVDLKARFLCQDVAPKPVPAPAPVVEAGGPVGPADTTAANDGVAASEAPAKSLKG